FNSTPPTITHTLSLHDALPISFIQSHCPCMMLWPSSMFSTILATPRVPAPTAQAVRLREPTSSSARAAISSPRWNRIVLWMYLRSEEHTSELQSRENLVCRLLL